MTGKTTHPTGLDIKAAIERRGLPEGLDVYSSAEWCQIEAFQIEDDPEPCAAYLHSLAHDPVLEMYPDHPRALECATLLLDAYREVMS